LDAAAGRVLSALDEFKLADHTIVIFTSDNGGLITKDTTSNKPLRFDKASAYEGGVRVPLIIRWPGVTRPNTVSDSPVISMDLFPTLAEGCDLKSHDNKSNTGAAGRDGVSLLPLLRGAGKMVRKELFWHYPHHQHYQLGGATPYGAIRSGDFKLVEFFNDMHVELYDIRDDIGEQHDLSASDPRKVAELRTRLHAWRGEVGAQMPAPNPEYNPAKPEYTPPARKKEPSE
jgi:arylsulfatase A-like enzyme